MKGMTWLLLWLTMAPLAGRPASPPSAIQPLTARGSFFAIYVPDVEASAKWYSEKLGLKVVMDVPKKDRMTVKVLEGGGLMVELIQNEDAQPLSRLAASGPLVVQGIFKAGVIVDDLDQTLALLKARNVPIAFGPFPTTASQRSNAIIRDNDGNLIQFIGK